MTAFPNPSLDILQNRKHLVSGVRFENGFWVLKQQPALRLRNMQQHCSAGIEINVRATWHSGWNKLAESVSSTTRVGSRFRKASAVQSRKRAAQERPLSLFKPGTLYLLKVYFCKF